MAGIPAVVDNDAEDVAWALSTAEALWSNHEHRDALLWLERAAKAARTADNPSRAEELTRIANELVESLGDGAGVKPLNDEEVEEMSLGDDDFIEVHEALTKPKILDPWSSKTQQATTQTDSTRDESADVITSAVVDDRDEASTRATAAPPPVKPPPPLPRRESKIEEDESIITSASPVEIEAPVAAESFQPPSVRPDALTKAPDSDDAGLEETLARPSSRRLVAADCVTGAPPDYDSAAEDQNGVENGGSDAPTLAPPQPGAEESAAVASASVLSEPFPSAPRSNSIDVDFGEESTPRPVSAALEAPAELADLPEPEAPAVLTATSDAPPVLSAADEDGESLEPTATVAAAEGEAETPVEASAEGEAQTEIEAGGDASESFESFESTDAELSQFLDIGTIDVFADLPEDARDEFSRAALVQPLGLNEVLSGFALVILLDGGVDVVSTKVRAPAERLSPNVPVMSLGRSPHAMPIRLLGARPNSMVAVWMEDDLKRALRSCPWVEDDLRSQADHMLAKVGVTLGLLGTRLDASLRSTVLSTMKVVELEANAVLVEKGKPLPGIAVVGLGDLSVDGSVILNPGEFVFPECVLSGAKAPATVRAGEQGAFVLQADRAASQELLVTCPPLIEIFAGM